jgi:hypothetical protein
MVDATDQGARVVDGLIREASPENGKVGIAHKT